MNIVQFPIFKCEIDTVNCVLQSLEQYIILLKMTKMNLVSSHVI